MKNQLGVNYDFKLATVAVANTKGIAQAIVIPFAVDMKKNIVVDQQAPKSLVETLSKEDLNVVMDGIFYSFVYMGEKCLSQEDKLATAVNKIPAKYKNIEIWTDSFEYETKKLLSKVMVKSANRWTAKSKLNETTQKNITLVNPSVVANSDDLKKATLLAQAQLEVMRLVEMPSNYLTPKNFYQEAKSFADQNKNKGVSIEVLVGDNVKIAGYGAMYGVAKGSVEEAHMITLKYDGGVKDEAPIVLVGKGLTFDSGGISLKPSKGMGKMRGDMAGAATVLGAFMYAVNSGVKQNIVAILACCENMPSGSALKPGDVLTARNGKTIEVEDTDAEGRLVLADALCLAQTFNGKVTIDFATLTGACIAALGHVHTGMFTDEEELAQKFISLGKKSGDTVWQLPMGDEYKSMLESKVADLNNLCLGKGAGATNGAVFLKEFAPENGWVHMDIAGTSEVTMATGRPLPLISDYLDSL